MRRCVGEEFFLGVWDLLQQLSKSGVCDIAEERDVPFGQIAKGGENLFGSVKVFDRGEVDNERSSLVAGGQVGKRSNGIGFDPWQ